MEIEDIQDLEDGGALLTINMTDEEAILFLKQGILSTLTEAAKKIEEQQTPVHNPELGLALDNAFMHDRLDEKEKEIENLHIYKKAILKMCSHRQREIDDYIRIAKQAVEDDERNYYSRFPKMESRRPRHWPEPDEDF